MATRRQRITRRQVAFVLVGLLAFFGTIGAAQGLGWWSTSGRVDGRGNPVTTGGDPEKVKGWMTARQVCDEFGLQPSDLFKHFNIPAGTSGDIQLKDIESIQPAFSVELLRDWLETIGR